MVDLTEKVSDPHLLYNGIPPSILDLSSSVLIPFHFWLQGSQSEDMNNKNPDAVSSDESQVNEPKKTCADCGTSKTPLWRGGPAGPKVIDPLDQTSHFASG